MLSRKSIDFDATKKGSMWTSEPEAEVYAICTGPVTMEERNFLIRNDLLKLDSNGEYLERSTLNDSKDFEIEDEAVEAWNVDQDLSLEPLELNECAKRLTSSSSPHSKNLRPRTPSRAGAIKINAKQTPAKNSRSEHATPVIQEEASLKSTKTRRNTLSRVIHSLRGMKPKMGSKSKSHEGN